MIRSLGWSAESERRSYGAGGGVVGADSGAYRCTAPLSNYQITGNERAIGCLTAHRCVAVGYGGGAQARQRFAGVGEEGNGGPLVPELVTN